MAPVGVLKIFHPEGETGATTAAAKEHVPYILSTASSTSIEDVAKANGNGTRWYQLYWPLNEHNDVTVSLLLRAKKSGYKVLFVTLDTYILGWRPSDMDNGYNPFLRADSIGVEIGFTDPVFPPTLQRQAWQRCRREYRSCSSRMGKDGVPRDQSWMGGYKISARALGWSYRAERYSNCS